MRKVKMAAMQPNTLAVPNVTEPRAIMENCVKPQLAVTLRMIRQAGEAGCDIVSTSEDIASVARYFIDLPGDDTENAGLMTAGSSGVFPLVAELSAVYVEKELSKLAREYGMYIIGCYFKPCGGKIYNVASIFSREGIIMGEYRKTHLPPNELWHVTEGDSLPVFDLDFGRIGILICYDMMFPESAQVLSLSGAEIVFHPTAGYGWYDAIGEATAKTRANDGNFHLVISKNYVWNGAGKSGIIDHWGHTRAEAGFCENVIAVAEIDLDDAKRQPSWFYQTQMSGIAEIAVRYPTERRPDLYAALAAPQLKKQTPPDAKRRVALVNLIKDGHCRWS